jgi:hypothetical protein
LLSPISFQNRVLQTTKQDHNERPSMHLHSAATNHQVSFRFQKQHNLGKMGERYVSNRLLGGFSGKAKRVYFKS